MRRYPHVRALGASKAVPAIERDIVAAYNASFDDASAEAHHAQLSSALEAESLIFGGRPLCNVLRPKFFSEAEYRAVAYACRAVLSAIDRVHAATLTDRDLRARLSLSPLEEEACALQPIPDVPAPLSRLDGFLGVDGILRFVEYNAETPAGVGYTDVLARAFRELPAMRRLGAERRLRAVRGRSILLEALLATARYAGMKGAPSIAILDWHGLPTRPEFDILARYFDDHGVPAVIGAPDELRLVRGRLLLRDTPVTIVYKRVLTAEFLDRCGLRHPLVRAVSAGAAVMANPFHCVALHKKALFALLSDSHVTRALPRAERAAVRRHVPWTAIVQDGPANYGGRRIDLLSWAVAHRAKLVIKPNDEYGGRGVVLGWEVGDGEFATALEAALERPSVIQERVSAKPEPFPLWNGTGLAIEDRLVDLDPYCYHGSHMHGALTRLSKGGILNVSAGGGSVVPSFVVTD